MLSGSLKDTGTVSLVKSLPIESLITFQTEIFWFGGRKTGRVSLYPYYSTHDSTDRIDVLQHSSNAKFGGILSSSKDSDDCLKLNNYFSPSIASSYSESPPLPLSSLAKLLSRDLMLLYPVLDFDFGRFPLLDFRHTGGSSSPGSVNWID